jgi:hypothetical protein
MGWMVGLCVEWKDWEGWSSSIGVYAMYKMKDVFGSILFV